MSEISPWVEKHLDARGLGAHSTAIGSFTPGQNRASLIVGLVCACISLAVVAVTLRWFALMRRLFRHDLILLLVISDSFKAIWYFIFGVVAIARPVSSDSGFCQVSGYMLLAAMEMSDVSILFMALHTVLCIFKPSPKSEKGGLYPYRRWIYPCWIIPPFVAASLAFINGSNAYTTSGTYCFLPKRPFWYRLALSWIPRYVIISLILAMYAAIYIYVHVKFRGFKNLQASGSSRDSALTSRRTTEASVLDSNPRSRRASLTGPPQPPAAPRSRGVRQGVTRESNASTIADGGANKTTEPRPPWEAMSFITDLPLGSSRPPAAIATTDFGQTTFPDDDDGSPSPSSSGQTEFRKSSETPTNFTSDTAVTRTGFEAIKASGDGTSDGTVDHLKVTRAAIRKQLRFLFIYPVIYVIMWTFPFVLNITNYFDYFVQHPLFWLYIMSTISLALQAGVNGVVFSVKERPWRRIDKDSRFSINLRFWDHASHTSQGPLHKSDEEKAAPAADNAHWWEAEGRKRRDSVWLGTDSLTIVPSRRQQRSSTLANITETPPD